MRSIDYLFNVEKSQLRAVSAAGSVFFRDSNSPQAARKAARVFLHPNHKHL